jgi:hypothetical protein
MSSIETNHSNMDSSNMDSSNRGFKINQQTVSDVENQVKKTTLPHTVYVKSEPEADKCAFCKYMIGCFGVTLLVEIIFGTLVLYGFNIYSLTLISNKTIHKHCENSHIWEWMISFMVIGLFLGMSSNKKSEDSGMQSILNNICQLIIMLGMTCWGCYEVWGVDCVDKSLLLYTLSQVTVGFSITVYGIIIIGIYIGCTVMCIESNCMKKTLEKM